MTALAWLLVRAGGWPRMILLAACTAFVSGMLLVAVALLRLPERPAELLFDVVADPGTRGGATLAAVLITLPALLLLHQAVRLGSATRDRRLAALRVVGATPREVRRLGALEVGFPTAMGAALGIAVYGLLRLLLGGADYHSVPRQLPATWLMLVPTSVAPAWWQTGLVVCAVAAFGVVTGWRASRAVITGPLSVTRRQSQAPPRPWGLVLLVVAVVLAFFSLNPGAGETATLASVAAATVGIMSLAPWLGHRLARYVEARTGSAARLLAARRILSEPRAVGRAAAAVGAVALVSGGAGVIFADLLREGNLGAFYLVSLLIVAVMVLAGLLIVTATMAVHSVESLLERKRETAGLAAVGADVHELVDAQRHEGALVAMPMAVIGVLLGSTALILMHIAAAGPDSVFLSTSLLILALNVPVTMALVWLAVKIAVQMVRPWTLRATAADNLRTE